MAPTPGTDEIAEAWPSLALKFYEILLGAALTPTDHHALARSEAAQALLCEHVAARTEGRDLFHAAASLGRILAHENASPTLTATVLDGLRQAAIDTDAEPWIFTRLPALRAALFEAYTAGIRESCRLVAEKAWEWPWCAVRLGNDRYAICAGHPEEDPVVLGEWADRVASSLARAGARGVLVEGSANAKAAIVDALAVAGIAVEKPATRRSLRLPWSF